MAMDTGAWAADAPPGYAADTLPGQWLPDLLGPGFEYTTLAAGEDEDGPLCATLVRHVPESPPEHPADHGPRLRGMVAGLVEFATAHHHEPGRPVPAVLALHGWTDYFYNVELARYWTRRGYRFYALDLRRYGRSLRAWSTPGFTTTLSEYDADLEAAFAAMAADVGTLGDVVCVAHSTGGLIASLWADRNPGRFSALVLNSPWLETQGSWLVRNAAAGLLDPVARRRPKTRLKLPEVESYWQSMSREGHGHWDLHPLWRPRRSFPVTAGWLTAVMAGHAAVARGLDIREPILVLTAGRTRFGTAYDPEMLRADSVIEVDTVRQRAVGLGREVSVVRVPGAMHDVFASALPARRTAYAAVTRWAGGYLPEPAAEHRRS